MKSLPLLAVAAGLLACDASHAPTAPNALSAPTAASSAVIVNERVERATVAPSNCGGTTIFLQAEWHTLFALTFDGAGGVHAKFHINVQGQGSDPATGVDYVANQTENDELNLKVGVEETFTLHYNLIAKGQAPNALLMEDFHITITPNGDVSSFHDHFRIVCQ